MYFTFTLSNINFLYVDITHHLIRFKLTKGGKVIKPSIGSLEMSQFISNKSLFICII